MAPWEVLNLFPCVPNCVFVSKRFKSCEQSRRIPAELWRWYVNVLVVYDSVFGNTERIAQSIGKTLSSRESVHLMPVSTVKPENLTGVDLVIIGSPTRGFRPTDGITKFLKELSVPTITKTKFAVFDTRLSLEDTKSSFTRFIVKTGGYAARNIARLLRKRGGALVVEPEGFLVTGEKGPLKDGEMRHAQTWALDLLEAAE